VSEASVPRAAECADEGRRLEARPCTNAPVARAVFGGSAMGLASGWNISNTGSVAGSLAHSYGIALATVGLFTTALFVTHLLMQVPGGRASDRFGARRMGVVGLALIAAGNSIALADSVPALAIAMRALIGLGTGIAFVAGSDYVRAAGGSPFAQGLFGGIALGSGGLALAAVPQAETLVGWRAPYMTALALALLATLALVSGPADSPRRDHRHERAVTPRGLFADSRIHRLAVLHATGFGLSVVLGNWVVTLLVRAGGETRGTAGAVGALTLVLGVVTRPFGGWLLRHHPGQIRAAVAASVAAGAAGTACLAVASPLALALAAAAAVGLAAGMPFAFVFTAAARMHPEAPAAAVGFVNGVAALTILAGTPLLGLSFSIPGNGRIGFLVVALLWSSALLLLGGKRQEI
jgi:MFS family permease